MYLQSTALRMRANSADCRSEPTVTHRTRLQYSAAAHEVRITFAGSHACLAPACRAWRWRPALVVLLGAALTIAADASPYLAVLMTPPVGAVRAACWRWRRCWSASGADWARAVGQMLAVLAACARAARRHWRVTNRGSRCRRAVHPCWPLGPADACRAPPASCSRATALALFFVPLRSRLGTQLFAHRRRAGPAGRWRLR